MVDKFPFLLEAERDADGKTSFKKQKILQSDMLRRHTTSCYLAVKTFSRARAGKTDAGRATTRNDDDMDGTCVCLTRFGSSRVARRVRG